MVVVYSDYTSFNIMKKQKYIYKTLFLPAIVFAVMVGISAQLNTKAFAAPAKCYSDNGGAFVALSSCPTTGGDRTVVTYQDTTGKTISGPLADKCYASTGATGGAAQYRENTCANYETFATAARQNLCTTSGGQWVSVPASSTNEFTAGFACKCTSPQQYRNSICQDPTPTATNPATTDSPKVTSSKCDPESPESATNKCCLATDLNSDNCGIVGYLNLAFNFVSGGVTLAIIGNIIFAGIQYSTAQGDPSAVGKSKKRIRDAIAAFLMFLSLYAFMQWLIPGGVF